MRDGLHLHLPESFCTFDDNPLVGEWFHALVCHRKLTIIFIPVGEREGDDVIPGMGYVEIHASGRLGGKALNRRSCGSGHFNGNLAEVLGEHHYKHVAVDDCLDCGALRDTLNMAFLNMDRAMAIRRTGARGTAPCRRQQQAEQQNELFDVVSHNALF